VAKVKVSAVVSTYNSERFFKGRLDDLLSQTLYSKGQLEIVVVNAGSKQGERYIVRDYLGCVTYIESLREPIYTSWNRGLAIARGEYITNANTDDRLRPDALEVMARELDDSPTVSLVYADAYATETPNARWGEKCVGSKRAPYYGKLSWPEFDPKLLLSQCYAGQAPMWRAALHHQLGYFDDSYQLAGDYEMWLRMVACGAVFKHIPQVLGLFFDDGAGVNNLEQSNMESRRAILKWRKHIR
jgi:glycosyltransferase involved in cell wall biosynthesis